MSDNIDSRKIWKRWYPKEITLKKNTYINDINCIKFLKKQNFSIIEKHVNANKKNKKSKIFSIDKNSYDLGFQDGVKNKTESDIEIKDNLNILLKNLENSISMFEDMLYSRLLKTTLIVSSYIFGKKIEIDKSILLKRIKKILNDNNIVFKKIKIIVHPNNKKILESMLKKFFSYSKLELVFSNYIDVNGFKIELDDSNIDNTISARYKELCRLVYSKEL